MMNEEKVVIDFLGEVFRSTDEAIHVFALGVRQDIRFYDGSGRLHEWCLHPVRFILDSLLPSEFLTKWFARQILINSICSALDGTISEWKFLLKTNKAALEKKEKQERARLYSQFREQGNAHNQAVKLSDAVELDFVEELQDELDSIEVMIDLQKRMLANIRRLETIMDKYTNYIHLVKEDMAAHFHHNRLKEVYLALEKLENFDLDVDEQEEIVNQLATRAKESSFVIYQDLGSDDE